MYYYKMVVSYDGTAYRGWQYQPKLPTVAGVISQKIEKTFNTSVTIIGASRTDAGVHALGQVARIEIDRDIDVTDLAGCTTSFSSA